MQKLFVIPILLLLCSCAQLHHVQVGEIISHPQYTQEPFDIKVSESGVNLNEAAQVSKVFLNKQGDKDAENIAGIIGLFQMGPRTGNPVYVKNYAKNLVQLIYEACPSGRVTGLMSIRESRKYPVISGEIVRVTGYCLKRKGS